MVKEVLEYIEAQFARGETFDSPTKSAAYFCLRLGLREQEVFTCAFLDTRHRLIAVEDLFHGTVDGASVYRGES